MALRRGRPVRLVLVAVSLLLLAACGDDDGPGRDGTVSVTVDWEPPRLAPVPLTWTVMIVNGTDEALDLEFTTGQRADVILSRRGEDVYQWSRALVFTQELGEVRVPAGGERSFTLDEPGLDVDPGEYRLTAVVTAANRELRTTRQVTVARG